MWVHSWGHYQHLFLFNQLSDTNLPDTQCLCWGSPTTATQKAHTSAILISVSCWSPQAPTPNILRPTSNYFWVLIPQSWGLQAFYRLQILPHWGLQAPTSTILRPTTSYYCHSGASMLPLLTSCILKAPIAAILMPANFNILNSEGLHLPSWQPCPFLPF